MTGIKNILILAISSVLIWVSSAYCIQIGEKLPDFSIKTFDGASFSRAALDGKPFMLVFWNTWCPNCMRELPQVSRLADKFGPDGLKVLAINTAMNDTEKRARTYWKKYGYMFPAGFDHDYEIGQSLRILGVPTILLIDSTGTVRFKNSSLPDDIEERLKQLTRK